MHLSIENQINESRSLLFQHLHPNLPSIDDGQDLDEILDDSYEKDEYCSHESSALQSRDFNHRLPLSLTEVTLEREFLNAINWSCFVDPKTFAEQVLKLEGLITLNEYSKRKNNSITYVEMITFFKFLKYFRKDDQLIWENIIEIFKSILICSIAYFIAIGIVITSISLVLTVQNAMIRDSNRLFIEKNNGIFSNCTIKSINLISKFKLDNQFHDRYIFNIRWNPKRNQSTYEKNNPKKYERNFTH
ncbi:slit 2 protein-like [Sarcoptes scabiei]|nr:slit 2 protein-like [Sarcoptes scabiei]